MKRLYTPGIFLFAFLFLGCSKDFLKSYDNRIIGTWHISDVDRIGFGGNTNNLPFTNGTFTFYDDGTLKYTNSANTNFDGSWEIIKKTIDDETVRSLQITAIDFNTQQFLTEYYDDMIFASTNHFKANINSDFHTYVTHFRR